MGDPVSREHRESRLDRPLAALAALLPLCVAVARASSTVQWRSDLPALRDQALVAVGFGGGLATALTQLALLLPLGNHSFRAALVSALALALSCWLVWRIARRALGVHAALSPALAALLSAIAAGTAGLSATWQVEATVGGGAMFAVLPALAALNLALDLATSWAASFTPQASVRWLGLAALVGVLVAESPACAMALALAIAGSLATAGKRPPAQLVPALVAVAAVSAALLVAPALLRPLSPRSLSDVGRALSAASLEPLSHAASTRDAALATWAREVGLISLGLALLGLIAGALRERRAAVAGLLALILVDLLYPLSAASQLVADPLAALRALALAAFAVGGALGVAEVVVFLRGLRVPMARTAAILVVVFHVTVVAVTSDEAGFAADRSEHLAAEEWTDQALGQLPPRAAVLVHSPELAWRLWAAQTVGGQRPDVLVIPVPLLQRGMSPANLLPSEPALEQLLTDLALTGQATEFGLSVLADARPLHIELDRRWGARLVKHLTVDGAWLRFAPQVVGRSDRRLPKAHALEADGRIAGSILASRVPDEPTKDVVARTLKEHVAALSLVGMGADVDPLLDDLERLRPRDPFVVGARLRLAHAERTRRSRRAVDLRDLLRF